MLLMGKNLLFFFFFLQLGSYPKFGPGKLPQNNFHVWWRLSVTCKAFPATVFWMLQGNLNGNIGSPQNSRN